MKNLREKIKNIIKESFENDKNFETTIDSYGVSLYGLAEIFKGIDIDNLQYETKFSVLWSIEVESRTWGIKDIHIIVYSVRGSIDWSMDKEELDDMQLTKLKKIANHESETTIEGSIEFSSLNKMNGREWTLDSSDFEVKQGGELYPTDLIIDFAKMKITIS